MPANGIRDSSGKVCIEVFLRVGVIFYSNSKYLRKKICHFSLFAS